MGFFEDVENAAGALPAPDDWTDWNSHPKKLVVKWCPTSIYAKMPTKKHPTDAGYDIYSANYDPILIEPGGTRMIPTAWSMTPPPGYFGAIFARSGLASKNGIRPANCVAVIDENYTGHVQVPLHNDGDEDFIVNRYDRIAQLIFLPYVDMKFEIVQELEKTDRGSGGFGSTGVQD